MRGRVCVCVWRRRTDLTATGWQAKPQGTPFCEAWTRRSKSHTGAKNHQDEEVGETTLGSRAVDWGGEG